MVALRLGDFFETSVRPVSEDACVSCCNAWGKKVLGVNILGVGEKRSLPPNYKDEVDQYLLACQEGCSMTASCETDDLAFSYGCTRGRDWRLLGRTGYMWGQEWLEGCPVQDEMVCDPETKSLSYNWGFQDFYCWSGTTHISPSAWTYEPMVEPLKERLECMECLASFSERAEARGMLSFDQIIETCKDPYIKECAPITTQSFIDFYFDCYAGDDCSESFNFDTKAHLSYSMANDYLFGQNSSFIYNNGTDDVIRQFECPESREVLSFQVADEAGLSTRERMLLLILGSSFVVMVFLIAYFMILRSKEFHAELVSLPERAFQTKLKLEGLLSPDGKVLEAYGLTSVGSSATPSTIRSESTQV